MLSNVKDRPRSLLKAAELRSKYSIKTPDAIQIAIGIENNATLFLTNDKNLKRVKEITVIVLEEFLV